MHKDLSAKGLVVISLSVDEVGDKNAALDFLKAQKATFANYILVDKLRNEPEGDKKLLHGLPPIVHVFGRDGKLVKSLEGKKEIDGLDALVKEQLEKK
jgi:hypothetical protein